MTLMLPGLREIQHINQNREPLLGPDELMPHLFHDVQVHGVLTSGERIHHDSKSFPDRPWLRDPKIIELEYLQRRGLPGFSLKNFVNSNFGQLPTSNTCERYEGQIDEYIHEAWSRGGRLYADVEHFDFGHGLEGGSSLIFDREHMKDFVLCGGRYGNPKRPEEYGWDPLFKSIGLAAEGHWDMVRNHVENKAYMLRTFGLDANGTRTYYLDRPQLEVFSEMVELLAEYEGDQVFEEFLPEMLISYNFWMKGAENPDEVGPRDSVVHMPGGLIINRYTSTKDTPRPEGYIEDIETIAAAKAHGYGSDTAWHLRVAAATGHDFSSRTMADGENLYSVNAGNVAMMELQTQLLGLERRLYRTFAQMAARESHGGQADYYQSQADYFGRRTVNRKQSIETYFWNEEKGFYFDYDIEQGRCTEVWSAANGYMLDAAVPDQRQADRVIANIESKHMQAGGLLATLNKLHHNWDWNSWSFLEEKFARGAHRYAAANKRNARVADKAAYNWLHAQREIFKRCGVMMEKGDAMNPGYPGGGGEYLVVPGFGPTNGVYAALRAGAHRPGGIQRLSKEVRQMEQDDARIIGKLGLRGAKLHLAAHAR